MARNTHTASRRSMTRHAKGPLTRRTAKGASISPPNSGIDFVDQDLKAPRSIQLPATTTVDNDISGSIPMSAFKPGEEETTEGPGQLEEDRTVNGSQKPGGSRGLPPSPANGADSYSLRLNSLSTSTSVTRKPSMPAGSIQDAIKPTVTTTTNISGGRDVSPFGALARGWRVAVPAYTLKSENGVKTLEMSAAFSQMAQWGVKNGGRTDVPSATAPVVTKDNYTKIVSDLTPILKELSWRAPRKEYWSKTICERHEKFHATDVQSFGNTTGKAFVKNYLEGKTITLTESERENATVVENKVKAIADDARQALQQRTSKYMRGVGNSYYSYPGEQRAFGDGKQPYLDLAAAVKSQGEKLAAPPTPTATPDPD